METTGHEGHQIQALPEECHSPAATLHGSIRQLGDHDIIRDKNWKALLQRHAEGTYDVSTQQMPGSSRCSLCGNYITHFDCFACSLDGK